MKKNILLIVFLLFALSESSYTCINEETKTLKNGYFVYEDYPSNIPKGHEFNIPKGDVVIKELDALYKQTNDLDYLSDIGYVYIIQGKYKEAVELYLKIETIEPDRYSTASNIGTIYELLGENKKALEWINKSIALNPRAHDNSEWLHSKILEAKIQGSDFVKNVTSTFLIGTSFGTADNPRCDLSVEKLRELIDALYFQLHERVTFIKTKDRIMAILLFELANAMMDRNISKHENYSELEIYKMAKNYGFNDPIIDRRIAFVKTKNEEKSKKFKEEKIQREKESNERKLKRMMYYCAIGGFLIVLGIYGIVRFLKKQQ